METLPGVSFNLAGEDLLVLTKLLEAEQSRLLVEIRHTDHRSFREELRLRLSIVERLIDLCRTH
jgi:hypothetical protein